MKNNDILDKLMETPRIKCLGLKSEAVSNIIKSYEDILLSKLLEDGHIELDNGLSIEVVQLLDRVHVLRGVSYKSSRKYKLKLTMDENIYNKIANYYDKLREEIL